MLDKKLVRLRRAKKIRKKIQELAVYRLCVHRTPRHIYAQIIAPEGGMTVASASTLERDIRADINNSGNIEAATRVGKVIAERALQQGIERIAFDRSGFRYHGRIKAVAEAARAAGLKL